MIQPSQFLRRALLADAVFSGVQSWLDFGAVPLHRCSIRLEALLRETGLIPIAYAALVGWPRHTQAVPKALVVLMSWLNAAWTIASIALLFSGAVSLEPAWRDRRGGAGHCHRCVCRAAICRPAQKRRRGGGQGRGLLMVIPDGAQAPDPEMTKTRMTSSPVSGIEGYAEEAEEPSQRYESIPAAEYHRHVRIRYRRRRPDVLDVGAGTGRDAAWFASMAIG